MPRPRHLQFCLRVHRFGSPLSTALIAIAAGLVGGCPRPERIEPHPVVPLPSAAEIVNHNIALVPGTLRAVGSIDGHVTTADGARRSFSLDGTLFYLPPPADAGGSAHGPFVRLDLKKFGETQFLVGSNGTRFWYFSKEDGTFECGWHEPDGPLRSDLPIEPRQVADALGLSPIPIGTAGTGKQICIQRVVRDHQQVLFVQPEQGDSMLLVKEYWLDRYDPRLIGAVVFRDPFGDVQMSSSLSDYRRLAPGGPLLPHRMEVEWPNSGASLRFRVGQWRHFEQVKPDSIQFQTPAACDRG